MTTVIGAWTGDKQNDFTVLAVVDMQTNELSATSIGSTKSTTLCKRPCLKALSWFQPVTDIAESLMQWARLSSN